MKRVLTISLLISVVCSVFGQTTPVSVVGTQVQKEKVFDHTLTAAVINHGTLTGVAAGDSVTVTATATYDTEDADSNKTITVTFALGGPDSASYSIDDTLTFTDGIITRRQLYRDSVVMPAVKVYDKTTDCTPIYTGTARNYVTHHILTTIDSIYFEDPNVGANKPVHIIFGMNGEDEANYLPPHDTVINVSIIPRTLIVMGTSVAKSKTYDGTSYVEVTDTGWLSGILTGDTVHHRIVMAQYEDKMVGTGKDINVYFGLYGKDSMNYTTSHIYYLDGEILPIQLAADGGAVECSKDYDSTTHAVVTLPSQPVGVLEGEQVYLNTFADFEDEHVGTGKEVYFWYTIYGRDMANYLPPMDSVACTDGEIKAVEVGVEQVEAVTAIYPNPARDWVWVDAEQVTIYSMSGVKVYEGPGGMVDVSGLANGVYIANKQKLTICR